VTLDEVLRDPALFAVYVAPYSDVVESENGSAEREAEKCQQPDHPTLPQLSLRTGDGEGSSAYFGRVSNPKEAR
jgi:hypothetical protein